MPRDTQLDSLRKTLELGERRASQQFQDVERVVGERRKIAVECARRADLLRKRIDELERVGRVRALQRGNVGFVSGATGVWRQASSRGVGMPFWAKRSIAAVRRSCSHAGSLPSRALARRS